MFATVYAADGLRSLPRLVQSLGELGFAGVLNAPSVGLIDGEFRRQLEEAGYGYEREVELVNLVRRAGLVACAYVFDDNQADQMLTAGADILIAHMGITRATRSGHPNDVLFGRVGTEQSTPILLCHGGNLSSSGGGGSHPGPMAERGGLFGASPLEGVPFAKAVANAVSSFKALRLFSYRPRLIEEGGSQRRDEWTCSVTTPRRMASDQSNSFGLALLSPVVKLIGCVGVLTNTPCRLAFPWLPPSSLAWIWTVTVGCSEPCVRNQATAPSGR